MKKMLMVATVPSMIGQFNMNNIKLLKELEVEVHVACNFKDRSVWTKNRTDLFIKELDEKQVFFHQIDFVRNPFDIRNIQAYKQMKRLVDSEEYVFIHCHTPVAGIISRIVGHKKKIKVIYTVHGFHFFEGAPKINWVIFFPIEKFFSRWTDTLITINKEDFNRAKTFYADKLEYIPGIGIDVKTFDHQGKIAEIRKEFGFTNDDFVFASVGQLSIRKNHQVVIKALAEINNSKIKYLIIGIGEKEKYLRKLISDLSLENRVYLVGYRMDVEKVLKAVDAFIFPSIQEGLPVSLMEAMAAGLPIVCSRIRGNVDLIKNGSGGYLCEPMNIEDYRKNMLLVFYGDRKKMGKVNTENAKRYDISIINEKMKTIYSRYLV